MRLERPIVNTQLDFYIPNLFDCYTNIVLPPEKYSITINGDDSMDIVPMVLNHIVNVYKKESILIHPIYNDETVCSEMNSHIIMNTALLGIISLTESYTSDNLFHIVNDMQNIGLVYGNAEWGSLYPDPSNITGIEILTDDGECHIIKFERKLTELDTIRIRALKNIGKITQFVTL